MSHIEEMFIENQDCIYRFCLNICDNLFEAEDLFQDTFVKAMEKEKTLLAVDNQRNYLIGIAIKLAKNNRRKKARRNRITPQDQRENILESMAADQQNVEQQVIDKEQILIVRENIRRMDKAHRVVAALFYGEELTIKEIAEILNIPQGTAKSRLYKVRQQLRHGLEDEQNGR